MTQAQQGKQRSAAAVEEDELQYGSSALTGEELGEKYPNRPKNHSQTMVFSELFKSLFNPLNENKKQPSGPTIARTKLGPHGPSKVSPQEQRRLIVERFIARWRSDVGNDFYPALRLILPDKDRDRGVYGLKENAIGKLLVKLMKIDKNSEDGYNLLHWKLPGQTTFSRLAGDFAGRCYEVLSKRQMRTDAGDMRIAEVNRLLDQLASSSGELEYLEVFEEFYNRMNAEELMWLIRIILKQMKVGATERTFLALWHPDGEALFSVSSSLRRVCWELWDPAVRLEQDEASITLMQCFQPQLAQFQMPASFQKMVDYLRPTEEDREFWIEEKLDGERMQMHMIEDPGTAGGRRFCWWSRKAKDYTYLYGNGLQDDNSAVTRHLKDAFHPNVKNIILDGEMITWDPEVDKIMPFGTLKTAALAEQKNPYSRGGPRPLFKVFDILYLNNQDITRYTLRERRNALEKSVRGVHRRLEIHEHVKATSPEAIEPLLRKVVAEASEGLVLKNPRSMYRLNSRNDDWLKVKPEYMSEFGESLDCVVIGGYYGSGRRGGMLSSFLCGLRVSANHIQAGANPEKCLSFFKVGGGMRTEDYAEIRHRTDGKWIDWDSNKPPSEFVELAGGERLQYEKPDVWIRPRDSVVMETKAASVGPSDSFATGFTLRFPRFRRLRLDKSWDQALDVQEFAELRKRVEAEAKEKTMEVEDRKRYRAKKIKRELVIAGEDSSTLAQFQSEKSKLFEGLEFCVLTEALKPVKKTKAQLEAMIKEHGGRISQRPVAGTAMILVGEKNVVKVASLIKAGDCDIVRPRWVFDCLAQQGGEAPFLLPYEDSHLFHATDEMKRLADQNTDMYGDSYARDVGVDELREILRDMPKLETDGGPFDSAAFVTQLEDQGHGLGRLRGHIFNRCIVCFTVVEADNGGRYDTVLLRMQNYVLFGGGTVTRDIADTGATHIVILGGEHNEERAAMAASVRKEVSSRRLIPRVVHVQWIENCWKESTLVDEEAYSSFE